MSYKEKLKQVTTILEEIEEIIVKWGLERFLLHEEKQGDEILDISFDWDNGNESVNVSYDIIYGLDDYTGEHVSNWGNTDFTLKNLDYDSFDEFLKNKKREDLAWTEKERERKKEERLIEKELEKKRKEKSIRVEKYRKRAKEIDVERADRLAKWKEYQALKKEFHSLKEEFGE